MSQNDSDNNQDDERREAIVIFAHFCFSDCVMVLFCIIIVQ